MDEVSVPFGDKNMENAVLLLAAAEELGLGPAAVKTSEGAFIVPKEVHDRAFGERKAPAKKAAKKSAARKK
jgi:hypothetical protein